MKEKSFAAVILCLAGILLLAGCGDKAALSKSDIREQLQERVGKMADGSAEGEAEEPEIAEQEPAEEKDDEEISEEATDPRKEAYQEILYRYKEAQDLKYTPEEVESMGLHTELVQHGWPSGEIAGDVKYLYYDVDADGNEELLITYYGDVIDIYAFDGIQAKQVFSTPYRGIAEIHPDGMLLLLYSMSASDGSSSWYRYDTALADYFEVYECRYDDGRESYYTFCAYDMSDEERRQVEESYRDIGTYPVWVYEWSGELTQEEYEKIVPTTDPIRLPEGELLSDVVLPDDYEYADLSDNAQNAASENTIEITKDMQKKLNVFLSNFAEQDMGYFDYGRPDTGDLADFAYRWTYINKWKDLDITTDGYYTLSLDKVKNVVNKYLDVTLTDEDLNAYTWPNAYQGFISKGRYCVPAADGESYNTLAIVTALSDEDNNNFRAQFDIYDLDQDYFLSHEDVDSIPEEFYSYDATAAAAEPALVKSGSGYAVIKKDGDSYKLRYYDKYR